MAKKLGTILFTAGLLGLLGCSGYRPEGSAPGAEKTEGKVIQVPRAVLRAGESLDIRKSGCSLPREPTTYIAQIVIDEDGMAALEEIKQGILTDCIRAYIEKTVTAWRFDPPLVEGQPKKLFYTVAFGYQP
jgi:hypothetical protein